MQQYSSQSYGPPVSRGRDRESHSRRASRSVRDSLPSSASSALSSRLSGSTGMRSISVPPVVRRPSRSSEPSTPATTVRYVSPAPTRRSHTHVPRAAKKRPPLPPSALFVAQYGGGGAPQARDWVTREAASALPSRLQKLLSQFMAA